MGEVDPVQFGVPPAEGEVHPQKEIDVGLFEVGERIDYSGVDSVPPAALGRRLGRRTALTFPLFPPPQKN